MDEALFTILPHRPPMVMIDRLVEVGGDSAVAVKTFDAGSYGTDGEFVSEGALIEGLAQTVAALYGSDGLKRGRAPGKGMLVGVSDFRFYARARVGRRLELAVTVTRRIAPFCIAEGKVTEDGIIVAEGGMKFYLEEK